MSTIQAKVQESGLSEVYSSSDPQVDVVFVHGLNGHPYNTWATHRPEVFWPADLLPDAVKEQNCRILTYGYDSNVAAFVDGASKDHIHNHAEHLAARLVANRGVKARERPIVFVVHSLGGLVVKRLLIYCESINNPKLERLRSIYVSTFGILFLGTPHNGSDLAKFGSILQSIAAAVLPKKLFDSSPTLVDALKSNNETLQNINRLFIEIMDPLRIYFFHEQKPMDFKGTRRFVVEEDSASPLLQGVERMGIEKDHSTMCKFESVNAPGYDVVADAIASYAEEAPARIRIRWEREKRVREYYRQSMAREILGDSIFSPSQESPSHYTPGFSVRTASQGQLEKFTPFESYTIEEAAGSVHSSRLLEPASSQHSGQSQKTTRQPRVAPLLFRPNSIFVGFDIELDQLKHKLSSEKRSQIGTNALLVCGPPGSGKSHLARQYVWTREADYPAGIFWVDCKSKQSIDRYYWDIGQALGCLGDTGSNHSQSDRLFINEVRKCLESLQGWLIVFDGVFFDSDEALSDFVQYLPDSPGNSVIYTSVDPTLKNRHRLLNPSWIRVRPLSLRAARELLFKSLGMKVYTSTQQRKADELVKYYRCLPLGVHAAAHMLVAQGRSLEKFSPATSDKRLTDPFTEIVRALLARGYDRAHNLLTLLSFLTHKVPVVLLQFGAQYMSGIGREIESLDQTGGTKKDIDNSISVLLRYGLVERELQTYSVSSPGQFRVSPLVSRTTTGASVDYSSPTIPGLTEESSDLRLVPTHEDGDHVESPESVPIAIDTLRVHNITQAVVRGELKASSIRGMSYSDWFVAASQFLCESYRVAALRLGTLPGQGSVADYREYKTQVTTLWKLFPRSEKDASDRLLRGREDLKHLFHIIQDEIRNRSPSQSQSSNDGRFKYIGSIFETSASSDEEIHTPTSGLTRESTWSPEDGDMESESPTQYQVPQQSRKLAAPEFDQGYESDLEDLTSTLRSSRQWGTKSDMTEVPPQQQPESPRQAFLQAILRGHSSTGHRKDLGEFKPVPTVGKVSIPEVETIRPRSSSGTSSNFPWPFRRSSTRSEAEAALTIVQARVPSPGAPLLDRRASSNSDKIQQLPAQRSPLSEVSPNIPIPIIAADNSQVPVNFAKGPELRRPSKTSTSPRLANTVLVQQATRLWPSLPVEENITITRRYPAPLTMGQISTLPGGSFDAPEFVPSGYTSVPMSREGSHEPKFSVPVSRDLSHESNFSLQSAPAEPMQNPLGFASDPSISYGIQPRGIPSIDVAMSRSLDLGNGAWMPTSPIGLDDNLGDSDLSRQQTRITPLSAPTSAPSSPRPSPIPLSREANLDVPDIISGGKERASP